MVFFAFDSLLFVFILLCVCALCAHQKEIYTHVNIKKAHIYTQNREMTLKRDKIKIYKQWQPENERVKVVKSMAIISKSKMISYTFRNE